MIYRCKSTAFFLDTQKKRNLLVSWCGKTAMAALIAWTDDTSRIAPSATQAVSAVLCGD